MPLPGWPQHGEAGRWKQSDLCQDRWLVPIDVLARDLAVAERDDGDECNLHPLAGRGYVSIGCWPCTAPVEDGAHPRDGRWVGSDKTECGLHI